jgi:hypothetical protein
MGRTICRSYFLVSISISSLPNKQCFHNQFYVHLSAVRNTSRHGSKDRYSLYFRTSGFILVWSKVIVCSLQNISTNAFIRLLNAIHLSLSMLTQQKPVLHIYSTPKQRRSSTRGYLSESAHSALQQYAHVPNINVQNHSITIGNTKPSCKCRHRHYVTQCFSYMESRAGVEKYRSGTSGIL